MGKLIRNVLLIILDKYLIFVRIKIELSFLLRYSSRYKESLGRKYHIINELIRMALSEDLGIQGDVTSQAIFTDEEDIFILFAKDSGVLCGSEVFREVFRQVDPLVSVDFFYSDGDAIVHGDQVAKLAGKVLSILTAERTAINFLSFLSGIASKAKKYVDQASSRGVLILDTRKTLPGYRKLSKYAVSCGGAANHRQGLYDMVLIKDNHIDAAGSITEAVRRIRALWSNTYKIEVETRTLDEVEEAISCNVDRIMLDNMDNDLMGKAVSMVHGAAETEASGNMTLQRIDGVDKIGVDFISVGDITHSVQAFDFSLKQQSR
ncbi:MAG: carboxylating nicotinate-nucleotide diphosphorylase [Sphaerochaeta sp.]|nr:carboxylating nicotinate-nucleotide diphosphorylase [Sphaerochaeta sp.]